MSAPSDGRSQDPSRSGAGHRGCRAWYEARRPGLGLEFVDALDRILGRIAEMPGQFPRVSDEHRRGLLGRFPYGVYFFLENDVAVVTAILHMHRHPDTWRSRE